MTKYLITVNADNFYFSGAASVLKKSRNILLEECNILKNNIKVVQNYFEGANYERLKMRSEIAVKQINEACDKIKRACDFLKQADSVIFEYLYKTRYTG